MDDALRLLLASECGQQTIADQDAFEQFLDALRTGDRRSTMFRSRRCRSPASTSS